MGRTKQTARKSTGGKAPIRQKSFIRNLRSVSDIKYQFEHEVPPIQFGKIKLQEFSKSYKAKLKIQSCSYSRFENEELSSTFEEIVSWCIKNDATNLRNVLNSKWKKFDIYKYLNRIDCKDEETGYNIPEIAAASGNVRIMKIIQEAKPDQYQYLGNVLEIAIMKEDLEMVRQINKSEIEGLDQYLDLAIDPSKESIFKSLISSIQSNKKLDIALRKYIDLGRLDLVEMIMAYGKWVRTYKCNTETMLLAMKKGDEEILKYLIEKQEDFVSGGSIQFLNYFKEKLYALDQDETDTEDRGLIEKVIPFLLQEIDDYGIDMDFEASFEKFMTKDIEIEDGLVGRFYSSEHELFTELITYCISGEIDLIEESKHSIYLRNNAQDESTRFRAIDFAAFKGHEDVVKRLLEFGAVVEVENEISAIDVAFARGHDQVVNCLFEHGYKTGDQIHQAVTKKYFQAAKYLMTVIDIDLIDEKGLNPLHYACMTNAIEDVNFLLRNGADINSKSGIRFFEQGPLHFACMKNHLTMVKHLIAHGADIFQTDNMGFTALKRMEGIEYDGQLIVNFLKSRMEASTTKIHEIK